MLKLKDQVSTMFNQFQALVERQIEKKFEEMEESILVFFMSIADSRKFDIKR